MAFAHQVGGHAATILASPLSSSTLIKPASDRELEFYQRVGPRLADGQLVGEWTPGFYGTLRAHGPPPAAGSGDGTAAQEDNAAVLLRQPDVRPCTIRLRIDLNYIDTGIADSAGMPFYTLAFRCSSWKT